MRSLAAIRITEYITYRHQRRAGHENPNAGTRFNRIRLVVDTNTKAVIYKTADYHKPWNIGVTPDPAIQALIDELNAQLAPIFSTVDRQLDQCTSRAPMPAVEADGRLCESLIGDVATDALRKTYNTDFAITNSGGLRADLTCPTTDIAGDFCPAYTPPPYLITRGQVLAVLPFGNVVFTVQHQRRRAEDVPGERRIADAICAGALPAGLRPVLHLRYLSCRLGAACSARSARLRMERAPARRST